MLRSCPPRSALIRATLHLVNKEYGPLAEDFITLGMLPRDVDRARVVPALTSVFAEALRGGVSNLSFGDLSANLGETCLLLALPLALRGQPSRWLRADRAPHP